MNTQEAFQLLTLASARDGRTVDVEVATVWADDLSDVALRDAVEAAREHYRESTSWLMPAHIVGYLRERKQAARAALTMSPEAPDSCPDGRHRRLQDGTCLFCTDRKHPDVAAEMSAP